jgi:fumarate hydratase class II
MIAEPGSFSGIMPGKSNPTQCKALTMVAVRVFGKKHAGISLARRGTSSSTSASRQAGDTP